MKRLGLFAIALLLLSAAIWAWIQRSPRPEKVIRARLVDLQGLVSFRASDGNLAALAKLQQLGSLFTREAEIQIDMPGASATTLVGRDHIMQTAGGTRQAVGNLEVEFGDITVTLSEDSRSAVVDAIGKARGQGDGGLWIQQLRFSFIATEEGWLISRVETVRTFTRVDFHHDPVVQRSYGA